MPVVLDTNVVVAGLRSRRGASHELLRRLRTDRLRAVVSVSLLLEYEEVLTRERVALGLTIEAVGTVVDALAKLCAHVAPGPSGRPRLSDPDDEIVLEAALAGPARWIITHDLRHFRGVERFGVVALAPGRWLKEESTR